MKRKFTILTAALALLACLAIPMGMWGQTRQSVTIPMNQQGWSDAQVIGSGTLKDNTGANTSFEYTSDKGEASNAPTYYNSGTNVRFYCKKNGTGDGGSMTITPAANSGITITSVELTASNNYTPTTKYNVDGGSDEALTWSGTTGTVSNLEATTSFKFRNANAANNTNQLRITQIVITYTVAGADPTVETPTITPNGGSFLTSQEVSLACSTDGATIKYSTNNGSIWTDYVNSFTLYETTTVQAKAIKSGMTDSQVATATFTKVTPLANIAALTVNTTAGTYYVALDNAVVTYVNGNYAYIQDASGAVVMYKSDHGLIAGNVLNGTATVAYQVRNANPQITDLSGITPASGPAPEPTEVAASDWNYTFNNVLSQYFKVTGATITQSNSKYYVSLGGESIQLYKVGTAISDLDLTKTYSIIGFPTMYNSTKELQIFVNPEVEVTAEPSVTVTPNTINASAEGTDGALTLTYENITDFISFDYYFCDAEGNELQEDPDWIYAEIQDEDDTYSLNYIIDANDGAARTAYIKVYTLDDDGDYVYAIVTVTQAQYVADYATLPFEWEGGSSADFLALNGVTANGLGSDYAASNAPYLIKFDGTGDYIQIKTNERPGVVTIDVKMLGGTNTSSIIVQGSADGETFSDIETLTISGTSTSTVLSLETTNDFASTDRYVKLYFEKGSNVGVGPISIAKYVEPIIVPSITVDPATVNEDADEHDGTLNLTYTALEISDREDFGVQFYDENNQEIGTGNEPAWIEVLVAEQDSQVGEGYVVSYYMIENEGDARAAYFKVFAMDPNAAKDSEGFIYSNLVTITQAAPVAPSTGDEYALYTGELVEGDYVICYNNTTWTAAMKNTVESGRLSYETVTPENDVVITDDATIVWHIAQSGDYWTIYSADANAYAAGTGVKNKAQLLADGTDDLAMWTVTGTDAYDFVNKGNAAANVNAYLRNNTTYGFACYAEGTGGALSLYKKVEATPIGYTLTIEGYLDDNNAGGYYLIASPVTVDPATVEGMTEGDFDLYYFDQAEENEWRNYETEAFNLEPGKGYLYAHKTGGDFTLTGEPYSGDGKITLSKSDGVEWEGWNLVGNPFAQKAYLNREFYVMKDDGTEIVPAERDTVSAMEGIFVIAATNGEQMQFSTSPIGSKGQIVLNVTQNRGNVVDRAIVRFGQGGTLPKFMLNPNNTKMYIQMDDNDYAVVRSNKAGELPVNFEAAQNGTFTISVNTENLNVKYLHLIDRATGMDTDLLQTPSYKFDARTNDDPRRFVLVFKTGINIFDVFTTNSGNKEIFSFFSDGNWIINNEGEAILQVVDVNGRILSSEEINGSVSKRIEAAPGVYMLRLVNGDNVKVQKVVVK